MNSAQRVVLLAGAAAAIIIVALTPRVVVYSGSVLPSTASMSEVLAPMADARTIGSFLAGTVVAVALLWTAVSTRPTSATAAEARLSAVESRLDEVETLITEPLPRD